MFRSAASKNNVGKKEQQPKDAGRPTTQSSIDLLDRVIYEKKPRPAFAVVRSVGDSQKRKADARYFPIFQISGVVSGSEDLAIPNPFFANRAVSCACAKIQQTGVFHRPIERCNGRENFHHERP